MIFIPFFAIVANDPEKKAVGHRAGIQNGPSVISSAFPNWTYMRGAASATNGRLTAVRYN